MKVRFMNQDCTTMKAAADLAIKTGMSVCFLSMQQERRGLYKLNYITICDDASTMSSQQIMDRYYELLQKDIEAQPWNYLWTHRRWK
jgi:KDO2-lipid IV(A) lauroyltransferase